MTEQDKPDLLAAAKDAFLVLTNIEAIFVELIALLGHHDDRLFAAACTATARKLRTAIEAEEARRQPVTTNMLASMPSPDDTTAINLCDMAAILDNDAHEGGNA